MDATNLQPVRHLHFLDFQLFEAIPVRDPATGGTALCTRFEVEVRLNGDPVRDPIWACERCGEVEVLATSCRGRRETRTLHGKVEIVRRADRHLTTR